MDIKSDLIEYKAKFDIFQDLMKFRVREILMVSSYYDAYVLEQDGRLSEKIFGEYLKHDLRFIPRITSVSTASKALEKIKKFNYDLVVTMTRISDMNPFEFGKQVKTIKPGTPVVMLTYEFLTPDFLIKARKTKYINKVFYWLGDSKILLSIVKYVEDFKNIDRDIKRGVRVIILVEDSPRFYSIYLPQVYIELMNQTRYLIDDSINDLHRLLRMRARPKVITAETYEQAKRLYKKYKEYLLGVISDVRFPRKDEIDNKAGFRLARKIKSDIHDLPFLLQSSNIKNENIAKKHGLDFICKKSENLLQELHNYISEKFGFGDFVFRKPDRTEIDRAKNLFEFVKKIDFIPDESFKFHASRNHISIWLRARTEFEMAEHLRYKKVDDFKNIKDLRKYIKESINLIINRNRSGVISDFLKGSLDRESNIVMIGNGSMGGKARGIAFLSMVIEKSGLKEEYKDIIIKVPKSFVICSNVFEEYVKDNKLLEFTLSETNKNKISEAFLSGKLPSETVDELSVLLDRIKSPIAVRSSSILEDSQNLPFAGLYSTFMLPNNCKNKQNRLVQLCDAIKLVFASVFYKSPKEYIRHTSYRIEEEKMAVIIQEVTGNKFGNYFYPVISGIIQSYNFYPISHQKNSEGIVELALGLGKTIVDGGKTYRFSPKYPQMNPPYSNVDEWIANTQNDYFAIDLSNPKVRVSNNDNFSLVKLELKDAEKDGNLSFIASTFIPENDQIRDNLTVKGPRIITFAPILKYDKFPISKIVDSIIKIGKMTMGCDVNVEFTLNIFKDKKPEFNLLQIRPMVSGQEDFITNIENYELEGANKLCYSLNSMGNGVYDNITDIIYIDPELYDPSLNKKITGEIDLINKTLEKEGKKYLLIGFGRWGSSDPWLGVPVGWDNISYAKIIIESNFQDNVIDYSRGSHFFHNLTSLRIGYIHVNDRRRDFLNWKWIKKQKIRKTLNYVKHIRLKKPLLIKLNGRTAQALIKY